LSTLEVKEGDEVKKGQELGKSGATGLALGDHLHFEVLIQGVSVTPVEWWDGKWIRDHVGRPLREANIPLLQSDQPAAGAGGEHPPPPPPPPRRPPRRRAAALAAVSYPSSSSKSSSSLPRPLPARPMLGST
ncbi:MAG: M23 family metallopeptidase, partial [Candidatus Rokuibacteriota bacterium]